MTSRQDTLFRYLTMLQLIPRAPQYRATSTLQTLLEERGYKVDIRSIQRDLEKMSAHFPLWCNRESRPFRWSFDPSFKSNLPAMDTPTALTLVLAEEYLTGLLPQVAVEQLNAQFHTAKKFLDGLERNSFAHWRQYVKALPNGKALIPAVISSETWQTVTDALLNSEALEVSYLSRDRVEPRQYRLHPQGIVVRHSATYLLAMVNDYEDIRQFALHRIQSIQISQLPYRAKPDFSLNNYIAQGAFGYPIEQGNTLLKARIKSDIARILSETPVSESQKLTSTEEDGWVLLEAEVPNDQQTQWWLQSFGANIDVLEPKSWRQAILQQAQEIVGRLERIAEIA